MMDAVKIPRAALSDKVYEMLRGRIINGEVEAGAHLNMDALARQIGVSPTPVREAVRRLAAERLVSFESYRGVRVAPLLTQRQLRDLMRARLVLEVGAVRASHLDLADLDRFDDLVATMDQLARSRALDIRAFNEMDAQFHRLLVSLAGNEFLLHAYEDLKVHAQIARHFQGRSSEEARAANREHHRIAGALREGDLDLLAREVEHHVGVVLNRLGIPEAQETP